MRRHWLLLWVASGLSVVVFLARLTVPVSDPWLERVQIGAAVLLLVACAIAARWYVRHGPGPYRDLRKQGPKEP